MKQLKMLRPCGGGVSERSLPAGYSFESFDGKEAQVADWLAICRHGLLPDTPPPSGEYRDWYVSSIQSYPDLLPTRDLFFVLSPDGERVATSAAVLHPRGEGYIHMVAALPACRGLGIGHAMLSRALAELSARGATHMTLTTDDFRLAAIKTYLDAGFRPVLWHDPESDMRERWDAVIAGLGYEPVEYFEEI